MRKTLSNSLLCFALAAQTANADVFRWIEAERPILTNFPSNPFSPKTGTERSKLSGGDWIGAAGPRKIAYFAVYDVEMPAAADYRFFVRKFWKHGPYRVQFNDGPWLNVDGDVPLLDEAELRPTIVADWTSAGHVTLKAGKNRFRIESTANDGPIAFDCFVLTNGPFTPRGIAKPDEELKSNEPDWFAWDPPPDAPASPIDLRSLNEPFAGSEGQIVAGGGRFIHESTGKRIRFWGVNCGADITRLEDEDLERLADMLASRGVNLVRWHSPVYEQRGPAIGTVDPKQIANLQRAIRIFKQHGIYATLSIYFPSWLDLDESNDWPGYQHQTPYALLFFDPKFQSMYRSWWRALLTTPDTAGALLKNDPAVLSLELLNEDSLYFWTFQPRKTIPASSSEMIERQFGDWLTKRYGSVENALSIWKSPASIDGDAPADGRAGVLAAGEIAAHRDTPRARDTARFLYEVEHDFYASTRSYLRDELGAQTLVSGGNWTTTSDQYLTPIERAANLAGDFIDRHGYYAGRVEGPHASYAVEVGDQFFDRSALHFDPEAGDAKPKSNAWNPLLDTTYNDKPSMVSEIGWPEPNRFTTEAPLLAAALGAQQDVDAISFFAVGAPSWQSTITKYGLLTPTALAQSPAAALIYRLGLVDEGAVGIDRHVSLDDLLELRGISGISSRAKFVGRTQVNIDASAATQPTQDESPRDDSSGVITSPTGEISLDSSRGVLRIDSAAAKAFVGALSTIKSPTSFGGLTISSPMDYGAIAIVSLDGTPIAHAQRLLLQVMSEQHNAGWKTEGGPKKTITALGTSPILVRKMAGTIEFTDGSKWLAQPLGQNDQPLGDALPAAASIQLRPTVIHYVLTRVAP